jgi:hypothetical protein
LGGCLAVLASLAVGGTALAHDLDHPAPGFSAAAPASSTINAGGEDAEWELVATIPTGNLHSDLDFFTRDGITYASVGTLATGPNAAGQTIVQLTNQDGEVDPQYVSSHPSATCPGVATGVTGLQHDAEAAPKGSALVQFPNPHVDTRDTQIVVDATDASGRCHDQGTLAVSGTTNGGLEIIDVTDPAAPTEIGLTSHAGEAHTVNVDPKRPHIAFVSSSDGVDYDEEGVRGNDEGTSDAFDGIEVVDMSSCMNFPADASRQFKIESCDPDVYRYRWPTVGFASSSVFRTGSACHELEIYPDDRATCAAIAATLLLDFSGAFDDNGTPTDYSDDKPRGTPLPCARRPTSTAAEPWGTSAIVEDCVDGEDGQSLLVADWLEMSPRPELEGVEKLGAVHHMGFDDQIGHNFEPPYDSTQDIFVSHEAELTQSGRYILATDERGGGILPVGASCTQGADNPLGNGGIHAFPVDKLGTAPPEPTGEANDAVAAYQEQVYAKNSDGERAIFRAPTQTEPQGSLCTSHVFQQIPGQNRIFMGWYSQGTQVVDFTENSDGTIDFERAGYFVPEHANEWTSHVFKVEENPDGTFTYWGATGDFLLGDAGRNAIDVYRVTLPAPPKPAGEPAAGTPPIPKAPVTGCVAANGFDTIRAKPRKKRKRVRFRFRTLGDQGARAKIFRQSTGRRIARRKVKTFRNRERGFTWAPRRARNGFYDVRLVTKAPNGRRDMRHVSLRRKRGRFFTIPYFDRRATCGLVSYFTLGRSVFGGRKRVPLKIRFKLAQDANVKIQLKRRNGKVVRTIKARDYDRGKHRRKFRLGRKAKRGAYRVTLTATRAGRSSSVTLHTRYL